MTSGSTKGLKNLLIVTQFFPPSNAIASRRFGEMAPYFERYGYKPWIVTTKSRGPLREPLPQHQVFCQGQTQRAGVTLENWSSDNFFYRLGEKFGFRTLSLGRGSAEWPKQIDAFKSELKSTLPQVDCIIGSYGPISSFEVAGFLSKFYKAPWIADFRDLGAWREDNRNAVVKWYDRRIENRLVDSATGFVTVSETLRSILMKHYQKPTEVVYNGFDFTLEKPTQNLIDLPLRADLRYLYYAGQLYPHQMPSVALLLKTMTTLPTSRVIFRILGPRYLERKVIELAKKYNLESRVNVLPPCEPHIVNQEADRSLANLVFENLSKDFEWSKGTITGKLLRLLPLRPPILVTARPDSDISGILATTQRGVLCHTEAEIYRRYHEILDHPEKFSGDKAIVERFSKQQQAAHLCRFLDRLLEFETRSTIAPQVLTEDPSLREVENEHR